MGKKKAYKTIFFLNYQVIISGQDSKDKAGHLGSLLSLLPSHVPSPYLSGYQEICLTPSLSKLLGLCYLHHSCSKLKCTDLMAIMRLQIYRACSLHIF